MADNYVSLKEEKITIRNMNTFTFKELVQSLKKEDPTIKDRNTFRFYVRYGRGKFLEIFDFVSLTTGFKILEDKKIDHIYMIRQDNIFWEQEDPEIYRPRKFDPMLIFAYYPDFVVEPDLRQFQPEHCPKIPLPLRISRLPKKIMIEDKTTKKEKGKNRFGR
uniref:Uncharacterized protein n=2 Tax=Rhodnius prolixus TaxID=13249 RepID=T1HPK5_RHOPR